MDCIRAYSSGTAKESLRFSLVTRNRAFPVPPQAPMDSSKKTPLSTVVTVRASCLSLLFPWNGANRLKCTTLGFPLGILHILQTTPFIFFIMASELSVLSGTILVSPGNNSDSSRIYVLRSGCLFFSSCGRWRDKYVNAPPDECRTFFPRAQLGLPPACIRTPSGKVLHISSEKYLCCGRVSG